VAVLRGVTGISEQPTAGLEPARVAATVAGSTLRLAGGEPAVLLNSAGRIVATIEPGQNNVGHLPRGVYFLAFPRARSKAPHKVLLVN